MPIIDFKEIPESKPSKARPGTQDKFELFARDFLEFVGYAIVDHPDRRGNEKRSWQSDSN